MPLILGAVVLLLFLLVSRVYIGADAKTLLKAGRMAAAALLGLMALFLGVTGKIGPGLLLAVTAWGLAMGRTMPWTAWRERQGARGPEDVPPRRASSGMSRAEALKVLGLEAQATEAEIRAAHRRLILQNHPDKGGTSYLAAKVNEAKDVLLGE